MSIIKERGRFGTVYTPTCDGCGEQLQGEYDFYDAVDAKKAAGWRSVKDNGEWYDYCKGCQETENRMQAVGDYAGIKGRI